MKDQIRKIILEVVANLWNEINLKESDIEVNRAPEKFGDYATNVAMKLAGMLKKSPMEIAEMIREDISNISLAQSQIEKIEVVQPGFINFYFSQAVYQKTLKEIKTQGDQYGFLNLGQGKTVMVEFGQPNTHKAITVGHLKSAISGLSVVKIFEALGYKVVRANFFGDVGMHVAKTTWGMMNEKLPAGFEDLDNDQKMRLVNEVYVKASNLFADDKKVEEEVRAVNTEIYSKKEGEVYAWYKKIRDWSIEHQNAFFKELGIDYDRQYPESEIYEEAIEIVNRHRDKIFTESQGAVIYEGEKDGLNNWVFLTGEGNPTYSAKDLALAVKKFEEYNLDLAVVTTSVEQTDYFRAVIKVLEKINKKFIGKYKHIPFGWLLMDGKKTSSRMGKTIKAVDVLEESRDLAEKQIASDKEYSLEEKKEIVDKVALGGLKFMILSHEFHKDINYDPNEFIKLNGFSGPFILYSYVRVNSVVKKNEGVDLENLDDLFFEKAEERQLAGTLAIYQDIVLRAGTEITPHIICNYLYEVAQKFNSFYENCPIQKAENEIQKKSRLALAVGTGQVLKNGLSLLGIEILERM